MRARSQLRGHWRAWVALALVLGVAAGIAMALAIGARRTERAYPTFVLTGLAMCAIAALVVGRGGNSVAVAPAPRIKISGSVWWIAIGLVANLAMAETIGFVTASTSMFWLTARAFDDRHPIRDAIFAFVMAVSAYLLFGRLLQLPLPAGPLEAWL